MMNSSNSYLLDQDFLSQLDLAQEKELYVKIVSLNLDEEPLQEISGTTTGGSISIDGKSAVRRTCTLTMTTGEIDINAYYWGLHTKFKLYVGLKNKLNEEYPDIIWFPQGTFVITSFNTSQQVKNYTINITGKDKMCYLNGDVGGVITALTHDFGTEDYTDEYGVTTNVSRNIKDIITDAVHEFAHEPLSNIIINDLDDYGVELLEYRGENPLYLLVNSITGDVEQAVIDTSSFKGFARIEGNNSQVRGRAVQELDNYVEQYQQVLKDLQECEVSGSSVENDNFTKLELAQIQEHLIALNNLNKSTEQATKGVLWQKIHNEIKITDKEDFEELDYEEDLIDVLDAATKYSIIRQIIEYEEENTEKDLSTATLKYIHALDVAKLNGYISGEITVLPNDDAEIGSLIDIKVEQTAADIENYLKAVASLEDSSSAKGIIGEAVTWSYWDSLVDLDTGFVFNPLFELDLGDAGGAINPTVITDGTNYYTVAKIEYGQTAGYRLTNLTYAGDLIINAGASVTSMLDKLVTMLGDFEYFYDLNGRFIFQKKKTYVNTSWNNQVNNQEESYVDNAAYTSAVQYTFENSKLITAFSNTPNLANVKNDYSIWGTRKGITGTEIPVHLRYAIDTKPVTYTSFDGITYTTLDKDDYISYQKQVDSEVVTYTKAKNPNGLPEDWWELFDWANLYKFTYGYYPTEIIGKYATRTTIHPEEYFELDEYWDNRYWNWENGITTDDIILRNGKFYWYHGSCNHTLTWWQTEYDKNPEYSVYIYAPTVEGVLEDGYFIDSEETLIDTTNIRFAQDWRELIYQMAKDYRKHNREVGFTTTLYNNNPSYVKNGLTGYESYYTDMEGFWRQLFNPEYTGTFEAEAVTSNTFNSSKYYYMRPVMKQCTASTSYNKNITYYKRFPIERTLKNIDASVQKADRFYMRYNDSTGSDFDYLGTNSKVYDIYDNLVPANTDFDISTVEGRNTVYYTYVYTYIKVDSLKKVEFYQNPTDYWYGTEDMEYCFCGWEDVDTENNPHFSNIRTINLNTLKKNGYQNLTYDKNTVYCSKNYDEFDRSTGWKKGLTEYPETLNFWFDFLESSSSELGKYSVTAIGNRPKSANDNTVKAIYFRETPTVIFMDADEMPELNQAKTGYTYIQLGSNMDNLFTVSTQGKSAKDVLDSWLYSYSYCAESVNITALPVYYLEPNTRILIRDKITQINGEYIINRITLPLTAKGTMSITAEKAVERIY